MSSRTFLKIGDFARVCHTTKETLLHYDRKGVLKPGYVSDNGYRWYALKQFFDFDLILLLKETGSTLEEIKRYRNAGRRDGYLELFRESIAVLEKEQERIAGRLSMLNNLAAMGEEALQAEYDKLFFERRRAEDILVYPVDSEKITGRESSVECYSECLMRSLMDGNAIDPPLGMIIPDTFAEEGTFRICALFTVNRNHARLTNARRMEEGEYACFFHKGSIQSHGRAFREMMNQLAELGRKTCGHVYAYDQMNYAFACEDDEYVAKYVVRVGDGKEEQNAELLHRKSAHCLR